MTQSSLFSLSYPSDPKNQKVFEHRVVRFFEYSTSNMFGLILGAGFIALVLFIHGAETQSIFQLFSFTTTLAIISFFISQYALRNKLANNQLEKCIKLRVFFGCAIGVMYAFAVLLLPIENIDEGIIFLFCIYIVSIAIAIFQYSVIPTYYILFNTSIFLPLTFFILNTPNDVSMLVIVLLISCMTMFISKGLKVSKTEINLIQVNINLQAEVAEHRITRQKLQEMALYDNLTKVANRYSFEDSARGSILNARDNSQQLALLFIDLNNFKNINDTFGHEVGDKVLVVAANKIKKSIRSSDIVARLGGDEFVVVLADYTLREVKKKLIDSIQSALNENIIIDKHVIELRASIGISIYPQDGDTLKQLLLCADNKMYKQKNATRTTTKNGN